MNENRGLSLVELVISMGIMLVIFSIVFTSYVTGERLNKGGFRQIALQSRGRIQLEKISRSLRSAIQSTILEGGDRIRFIIDPNRTPVTTVDDITCEYYLSGAQLMYDPDVSTAGDEVVLLEDVFQEPGEPIFGISDGLIEVTFRLNNDDAIYGTSWSSIGTSITMRNV